MVGGNYGIQEINAKKSKACRQDVGVLEKMNDKKEYEIIYAVGEINRCRWKVNTFHLTISWEAKGIGFGELTFYYNTEDEAWECDSENMSDEFCKAVLNKWFEGIKGVDSDNTKTK